MMARWQCVNTRLNEKLFFLFRESTGRISYSAKLKLDLLEIFYKFLKNSKKSKQSVSNMKAWIHPALYQRVRLLVGV